jgi:hypothetical protein
MTANEMRLLRVSSPAFLCGIAGLGKITKRAIAHHDQRDTR